MNSLKSWALTVCLAALAAGMAGMISPKGNMEKVYKFAISLFLLACMLVPLFKIQKISLKMDWSESSQSGQTRSIQSTVESEKVSAVQENMESLVKNYCLRLGVQPKAVHVKASMNANNEMSVTGIDILLNKSDLSQEQQIKDLVKNELGIDASIKEG